MLNEFRPNWHNTTKKTPPTPLKAETTAAGANHKKKRSDDGEKSKRLSYLRFKALFLAK